MDDSARAAFKKYLDPSRDAPKVLIAESFSLLRQTVAGTFQHCVVKRANRRIYDVTQTTMLKRLFCIDSLHDPLAKELN
jgi:hypothetical protein